MKKNVLKMVDTNGKTLEFEFKDGKKYVNAESSFVYKKGEITKELLSYCVYELLGDDSENKISQIKFYDGVKKLCSNCLDSSTFRYVKSLEFPETIEKIEYDINDPEKNILEAFHSVNYVFTSGNPIVEEYFKNMHHNVKITSDINEFNNLNKKQPTQKLFLEMTDIRGQKYKIPFVFERKIYPYTLTHEVFEKIFEANKYIKPDEITSITVPEGVKRILVNDTTFGKNLIKINLPHSLESLEWRGLFDKNKFPDLSLEVNGLKSFYDAESMIMYFYDDAKKFLNQGGKNSMDDDLINNILSNPKLAEICVEKAFLASSNNQEIIRAIRPESLFNKNHKLSKLPDNVKMRILKLWANDSYFEVSKYSINQQREKFDEVISVLPEKFRAEFDLYITELLIKRYTSSLDCRDVDLKDVGSYMLRKGIEYCEEQLKQNNLSLEKKALFHKYIAVYSEGLNPEYKSDKDIFSDLFNLIQDANGLEKWFSDSHYEIAAFEGIMDANFGYKSIVPKDMDGKCLLVSWCQEFCKDSVLPAVKKFNFDEKLDSEQRLKELYLGTGYFEGLSLNIRAEIAANMETKSIRDIYTWNKFINSIDPAKRSGEMDIAFFKSLSEKAFDYNILEVLDTITGKKKNIVPIRVSQDDIKIEFPERKEEKISLLVWLLNLFSKIREFFRNLFVGQKKIKQLPGGKDKTPGKQIDKSGQKKICPVEVKVIKTKNPVQIPKMKNIKGNEKTIGG